MNHYPQLDVLKVLCALAVMAIHAGLYPKLIYPWGRLAVPLFFLMSSYFFFCHAQPRSYSRFISRIIKMYCAWFLISLPVTVFVRWSIWFVPGGWLRFIMDLLFSSTFVASWFFTALLWAVFIINSGLKKCGAKMLVALSVIPWCFSCLCSSYPNIVAGNLYLCKVLAFHSIFANPSFSVTAALLPVAFGALFAEITSANFKMCLIVLIIGCVGLSAEWNFVRRLGNGINNDCYFTLPLVYCPLFMLVKNIRLVGWWSGKGSRVLRLLSVISFPLHVSVFFALGLCCKVLGLSHPTPLVKFFAAMCASSALCYIIMTLERKGSAALRWLH